MSTPKRPTIAVVPQSYGNEVLCASWNPLVPALVGGVDRMRPPAGAAAQDPEALVRRFYLSQQI